MTLTGLLVGSHFVPPAKALLEHLPSGTPLALVPEPDNPYDEGAIKVFVDLNEVPESETSALREALQGFGADWDELLAAGTPLPLGHVAKTGNRPLQGTDYAGTEEFHAAGAARGEATLGFDPQGRAILLVDTEARQGEQDEEGANS